MTRIKEGWEGTDENHLIIATASKAAPVTASITSAKGAASTAPGNSNGGCRGASATPAHICTAHSTTMPQHGTFSASQERKLGTHLTLQLLTRKRFRWRVWQADSVNRVAIHTRFLGSANKQALCMDLHDKHDARHASSRRCHIHPTASNKLYTPHRADVTNNEPKLGRPVRLF